MRLIRALVFGLVWSFVMAAIGIKVFSIWFFLSVLPAVFIFETIEVLVFSEPRNKGGQNRMENHQ